MNISPLNIKSYCANSVGVQGNSNCANNINFGKKYYLDVYKAPHKKKIIKHEDFIKNNVISGKPCFMQGWWTDFYTKDKHMYPWKMHLYSDDVADWQRLVKTVEPYFTNNQVHWKTLSYFGTIDDLNKSERQKGKAITIYPHSRDEFYKLAYELNYIIKKNGLQKLNTSIKGDRELGNSGRIFYRYELNSGKYKDMVFDESKEEEKEMHNRLYSSTSKNCNYRACDMNIDDDPFYYYCPDTNTINHPLMRRYY